MSVPPISHEQPTRLIRAAGEAFAEWRKRRKIGRKDNREKNRDDWISDLLAQIPIEYWNMWPVHEQQQFCNEVYAIQVRFDGGDRDLPGASTLPTVTESTCSTVLYRMNRSVCRLLYIVHQIARHLPAAERPAVDIWFHDGFLAHMRVPYWDSLGVPFGPNALHAIVAVKEFESVLEQVRDGRIKSPTELPEIGNAVHFPTLHRLMAGFERLHPEHAESSPAAVDKRKRRGGSGSDEDPARDGLKRRTTAQDLSDAELLMGLGTADVRHNAHSLAHRVAQAQHVELSPRQRATYGMRWAGV
ncbi:hypothetical protein JCM9279_005302 [Rhodotorula babjevae]